MSKLPKDRVSPRMIRDLRSIMAWAMPGGKVPSFKEQKTLPLPPVKRPAMEAVAEQILLESKERGWIEKALAETCPEYDKYWMYRTFPEVSDAAAIGRKAMPMRSWRVLFMGYEKPAITHQWVLYVVDVIDYDDEDAAFFGLGS